MSSKGGGLIKRFKSLLDFLPGKVANDALMVSAASLLLHTYYLPAYRRSPSMIKSILLPSHVILSTLSHAPR